MSDDRARELQEQGVLAAKAGQKDQARRLLQQAIRLNPRDDMNWLWLASVVQDKRERLLCLQKVLQINPDNEMAIKAVRALGIDPEQLAPRGPSIDESLADDDEMVEGPGVPMPSPENLEEVRNRAQEIADFFLEPPDFEDIIWEHKTKRRAGEREIFILRMQIGFAISIFLTVVIGGLIYAISTSPQVQLTLFGASATPIPPTSTPTNTATNTPGFRPTASPTRNASEPTFTLTPTIDSAVRSWEAGYIDITPTPTELYIPGRLDTAVEQAIDLLEQGDPEGLEEALDLLGRSQSGLGSIWYPSPYYFEAITLMTLERYNEALTVLEEAEQLIADGRAGDQVIPFTTLIDLGFAEVHLQIAKNALAESDSDTATTELDAARTRARNAHELDQRYAKAYVLEAETYTLEERYEEAIAVLNESRAIPTLIEDQTISMAMASVYLAWGNHLAETGNSAGAWEKYNHAAYEGFYTTYINPFVEEAHQIRIHTALAMGDIGLAAIRCEDYLHYFPNSAEAFRLFGDIRIMQNNTEFALYNYTQALNNEASPETWAQTHISRAKLFIQYGRFSKALDDLNAAVELDDKLTTRAFRMSIAYAAGNYEIANEDAEQLSENPGQLTDTDTNLSEIRLIQAQILVDEAGPGDRSQYQEALNLLARLETNLPAELNAVADEYRAWAYYGLGRYGDALAAVERALAVADSGKRHYLRGLIYERLGQEAEAIAEYQWVLTWDTVYHYSFAEDAQAHLQAFFEPVVAPEITPEVTAEGTPETTPEVTPEITSEATPEVDDTPTPETAG